MTPLQQRLPQDNSCPTLDTLDVGQALNASTQQSRAVWSTHTNAAMRRDGYRQNTCNEDVISCI